MLLFDQEERICVEDKMKSSLHTSTTIIRPKLFSMVLDILHSEQPYSGGMEYHFI